VSNELDPTKHPQAATAELPVEMCQTGRANNWKPGDKRGMPKPRMIGSRATVLPWGVRSPTFEVQGSGLKGPVRARLAPLFPCPRADLEYDPRRWCRAASFPSHAGNRRNAGPPIEAHEDLFTGNAHVNAEGQFTPPLTHRNLNNKQGQGTPSLPPLMADCPPEMPIRRLSHRPGN
jgi:hypothetical protein